MRFEQSQYSEGMQNFRKRRSQTSSLHHRPIVSTYQDTRPIEVLVQENLQLHEEKINSIIRGKRFTPSVPRPCIMKLDYDSKLDIDKWVNQARMYLCTLNR